MSHFRTNGDEASGSCALLRLLDALAFGGILLGEDGRVLQVNSCAERHYGAGIVIQAGHLAATDADSDRILQELLTAHLRDPGQAWQTVGLRRADRQPLALRLQRVQRQPHARLGGARLVAVLADPDHCPEPSPAFLQQTFGLTRKEAQVAIQLMCGRTIQEIADDAGIGLGTVRAQTKAVLGKTGTSRQAELVGLMTRLAVVAGGLP